MVINTNISSLTAQEAAKNTNSSLSSSLEKLSTGLKINKASDDASGLAIADKLRTQVTSINQAVSNGNSAVSLLQIADKSMSEQSTILDTIKAKLIQANTDTTSDDGREAIRKDVVKLLEQLDNIAEQTNYNGNVLLQDSSSSQSASSALAFQVGESKNDVITNNAIQSNTKGLGGGANAIATSTGGPSSTGSNVIDNLATMELSSTGTMVFGSETATGALKTENIEVAGQVGKITATAGDITLKNADAETTKLLNLMIANGATGLSLTGDTFTLTSGNNIDFEDFNVSNLDISNSAVTGTISMAASGVVRVTNLDDTTTNLLTVTSTTAKVTGGDLLSSISALGEGELTKEKADKFQGVVDNAITDLNGYRGDIGSTQNQVESAVRNLMTASTNVSAAESIIRDVDYAEESANFNKQNIISQAGSYAISQANTVQQNVLKLLQ